MNEIKVSDTVGKYVMSEQEELWIKGDSYQCPLCREIMDVEKKYHRL